jgi:ribosomal protein S12 methylthiotransferase accessory factor YcaO
MASSFVTSVIGSPQTDIAGLGASLKVPERAIRRALTELLERVARDASGATAP